MHLKILPLDDEVAAMYQAHQPPLPGDAGFDLFCPTEVTVNPGETVKVDFKIRCSAHADPNNVDSIPYFLMPRSSISKTPLRLANSVGLIDAGYRGNLLGLLDNIKNEPYIIKKGERLLQAVSFDGSEISHEIVTELMTTVRGARGIGSTGQAMETAASG